MDIPPLFLFLHDEQAIQKNGNQTFCRHLL